MEIIRNNQFPMQTSAAIKSIFISYSRKDKEYVAKLAKYLEGHGVSIWWSNG